MIVVTSRFSRACVHSDCSVYIALPSASRFKTLRSGHATAAPVATGMPCPIAPPVSVNQSWRGAPSVAPETYRPPVCASSLTIAPSGSKRADRLRDRLRGERSGRPLGPGRRREPRARRPARPARRPSASSAASARTPSTTRSRISQPSGAKLARQIRVREERHRFLGVDEHEVAQVLHLRGRELREVGQAFDRGQSRAPLEAGRERLAQQPGAGGFRDARRGEKPTLAQRLARRAATRPVRRSATP